MLLDQTNISSGSGCGSVGRDAISTPKVCGFNPVIVSKKLKIICSGTDNCSADQNNEKGDGQCDQMIILCFQYSAIYSNEILPKSTPIVQK